MPWGNGSSKYGEVMVETYTLTIDDLIARSERLDALLDRLRRHRDGLTQTIGDLNAEMLALNAYLSLCALDAPRTGAPPAAGETEPLPDIGK